MPQFRYKDAKPQPALIRRLVATAKRKSITNMELCRRLNIGVNTIYNWKAGYPLAPQSVVKVKKFLARLGANPKRTKKSLAQPVSAKPVSAAA